MISKPESVVNTIVDLSSVKRFHGRKVIQTQTVADHSARVAMLSFFIALEFYEGDKVKANYVSTLGLFHDFPEAILKCDVSSPLKAKGDIGATLKQVELKAVGDMFDDKSLQDLMLEVAPDPADFQIMKLADSLDFGLYSWEEVTMGNTHMQFCLDAFKGELSKFPKVLQNLEFTKSCIKKILG